MKYLYYKLWQIFKRIPSNDTPATNAMIFLSIFQSANIVTLQLIINHSFGFKIMLYSKINTMLFACAIGLILYLINYFYLYKGRDKLHEKYKEEGRTQSVVGIITLVLYLITSIVLVQYFGTRYRFM